MKPRVLRLTWFFFYLDHLSISEVSNFSGYHTVCLSGEPHCFARRLDYAKKTAKRNPGQQNPGISNPKMVFNAKKKARYRWKEHGEGLEKVQLLFSRNWIVKYRA